MTTTKITKEKLNLFVACGKHYVSNANESELSKAVEAVLEPAIKKLKKVERQQEIARLSLAKKTSSKHIERDKYGNNLFTEADNIKLLEKIDEINAEEVDLPIDIVEDYPSEGITYDIRQAFEGIVIPKIARKFDNLPDDPKEDEAEE